MKRIFSTPPNENFFSGYYDKSPLDRASTRLLAQRVEFIDRLPVAGDQLQIGYFDFPDGQTFHQLASTSAWNWQQGCMLQWRGPTFDREIIYNDIRDNRFVSLCLNLETNEERALPMAVYSVSSDGKWAVCIDNERHYWVRPGYNYQGIENLQKKQPVSVDDGIWLMSLDKGDPKQIIRLGEMLDIRPLDSMKSGVHYLEHLMDCECCWMALTRVGSISRILGEDLIDKVLALAVYCEECGEEFLREDLDLVVCKGCGEAALVC